MARFFRIIDENHFFAINYLISNLWWLSKELFEYNQQVNKDTIEYIEKFLEIQKFNHEKSIEALIILKTQTLEVSQENMEAVQQLINM